MATYPPSTWAAPSSLPAAGTAYNGAGPSAYLIDSWVSATHAFGSASHEIRYITATDPRGSWTATTDIDNPSPLVPRHAPGIAAPVTNGTTYAVPVSFNSTVGRIYYTDDVTGHWTLGTVTNDVGGNIEGLAYGGGTWAAVANNNNVYYATDVAGPWTSVTTSSNSNDITYADGYWARTTGGDFFSGYPWSIEYTTDITSASWSTSVSGSGTATFEDLHSIKKLGDYWVAVGQALPFSPTLNKGILYWTTDIVGGSWTTSNLGFSSSGDYIWDITWDGTYWVAVGARSASATIRYSSAVQPDGAYTAATTGISAAAVYNVETANGYMAASAQLGKVTTVRTNSQYPYLPTPTYLRQRQSPVRAPSRVRPVNLRNRQTTMIR